LCELALLWLFRTLAALSDSRPHGLNFVLT
jgi:hypothetical protein